VLAKEPDKVAVAGGMNSAAGERIIAPSIDKSTVHSGKSIAATNDLGFDFGQFRQPFPNCHLAIKMPG
jgi:hypothetical protein